MDYVIEVMKGQQASIVVCDGAVDVPSVKDCGKHLENLQVYLFVFILDAFGVIFTQELYSGRLFIAELLLALRTLKENGIFVCKLLDVFSPLTHSFIYVCAQLFKEVFVVKPFRCRIVNSERYLACKVRCRCIT